MTKNYTVADLELGDVVRLGDGSREGPYLDATVVQKDDKSVTVVRPFVRADDFTGTWGLGTALGQERFSMPLTGTVTLLERNDPEATRRKVRELVDAAKAAVKAGDTYTALRVLERL